MADVGGFDVTGELVWRVIVTRPAAELRVVEALKELIERDAYAPVETVWRGRARRKKPYDRPLIRGYVFAELADGDIPGVHAIEGFGRMLMVDGRPARVRACDVQLLRDAEAEGTFDLTGSKGRKPKREVPRRAVGDRVRVERGAFEGIVGVVTRLKGDRKVQVLLGYMLFGRRVERDVTIDLACVAAAI